MADVFPFQALYYNPAKLKLQQAFSQLDSGAETPPAYHISRLLTPDDDAVRTNLIQQWTKEGIITTDESKDFYILRQSFSGEGGIKFSRTGFIGLWNLPEAILNQYCEDSYDGPVESDVLSFRPLLGFYDDTLNRIDRYISFAIKSIPLLDCVSGDVRSTIWKINDGGSIAGISREMKTKNILLASAKQDMQRYCVFYRKQNIPPANALFMTLLFNVREEGIVNSAWNRLMGTQNKLRINELKNEIGYEGNTLDHVMISVLDKSDTVVGEEFDLYPPLPVGLIFHYISKL